MSQKPVMYLQYDQRWGALKFSKFGEPAWRTANNGKPQTIASSGCGITCMAMVLATFLNDPTILPDYTAKLCMDNGYRTENKGTDFGFFPFCAKRFNLDLKVSYDTDEAVQALQNGALVICSMTKGYFTTEGHFILAYSVQNGQILVNEPAHPDRDKANIGLFRQQCQKYFIFKKEEHKPMDWKQIIEAVSQQYPEWEKAIDTAVNAAKADGNLGDLEIFQYLPLLIEKVYAKGAEQ